MNKFLDKYFIEHKKLGVGKYNSEFIIDKDFFNFLENEEILRHDLKIDIDYDIKQSMINAQMRILGKVEVQCDICGEYYFQEIENEIDLNFKMTNELPAEDTFDELIYYSPEDEKIDLKKIIFDYIVLSIPLKKEHPLDENGNRTCKPEIIKQLYEDSIQKSNFENLDNWEEIKKSFNN